MPGSCICGRAREIGESPLRLVRTNAGTHKYISLGRLERTSARIVPAKRRNGYNVRTWDLFWQNGSVLNFENGWCTSVFGGPRRLDPGQGRPGHDLHLGHRRDRDQSQPESALRAGPDLYLHRIDSGCRQSVQRNRVLYTGKCPLLRHFKMLLSNSRHGFSPLARGFSLLALVGLYVGFSSRWGDLCPMPP